MSHSCCDVAGFKCYHKTRNDFFLILKELLKFWKSCSMAASSRKLLRKVEVFVTFGWWQNRGIVRKSWDTCHCEIPTFIFWIQVFSVCGFQVNLSHFSLICFPNTVTELLSQNEGISFLHLYLVSSSFTYLQVWVLGFFFFFFKHPST